MKPQPVVLVTGAAGSIGQALIEAFEAEGWSVVSTDRTTLARAQHVVADLAAWGDQTSSDREDAVTALRRATDGNLKAIVHNAAHQVVKKSSALTQMDWSTSLTVNVLAPFWLTLSFLDELSHNDGSALAISSIHERLTKPGFVAYATSKAALSALMRAMAVDLGGKIRCNALCPAAIATPMLEAGFSGKPEALEILKAHHPIGRIGTPAEVAAVAVFICSDKASFMTGSCVDLSGGISARLHDPV